MVIFRDLKKGQKCKAFFIGRKKQPILTKICDAWAKDEDGNWFAMMADEKVELVHS